MSTEITPSEMRKLSKILDGILNGSGQKKKIGFALLTFDLETDSGMINYISNAQRNDMRKALAELQLKWETELN